MVKTRGKEVGLMFPSLSRFSYIVFLYFCNHEGPVWSNILIPFFSFLLVVF